MLGTALEPLELIVKRMLQKLLYIMENTDHSEILSLTHNAVHIFLFERLMLYMKSS